MRIHRQVCALLAIAAAVHAAAAEPSAPDPIPYQRFVLDNGLTLIVHEDHKAPIVAVNVWYHVGSKNERPGKTGFAHLFEHLMFQGSEHSNDEYFKVFDRVGATEINGTTDSDRTNYFQNVPSSALDVALWMESDRMGHLLGVIDQARLDEQRGVVKNEKRQGEDQPYGNVYRVLFESAYPAGHPYSWAPIGSMEDLDAATLDDVRTWFRTWYGAANAVVVVAGDVDAKRRPREGEEILRRHSARAAAHASGAVGREAHLHAARGAGGARSAGAPGQGLERAALRFARRRAPHAGGVRARGRQDLAAAIGGSCARSRSQRRSRRMRGCARSADSSSSR